MNPCEEIKIQPQMFQLQNQESPLMPTDIYSGSRRVKTDFFEERLQ